LWAEGLNENDIHKEMFPVYCAKCVAFVACSQLGGKRFADDEGVETEVRMWLREHSKSLLC
jgi:hypothetical protein